MRFLPRLLILFVVTRVCPSSSSTISTQSTSASSIYDKVASEMQQLEEGLQRAHELSKIIPHKSLKSLDIISLNVGGEVIMTTRQTLTRIPQSTLAVMFSGQWDQQLPKDRNGHIFLDCNPSLFRYLLDQLQTFDVKHFHLPLEPSLVQPFKKMLRKLGLDRVGSFAEKKVVRVNVGGQIFTHRRATFTQMPNSTYNMTIPSSQITDSDVFIDSNPKVFQHLIEQLREVPAKNTGYLRTPSAKETSSFKKILNHLSVSRPTHSAININANTKWIQNGTTFAGGHGKGEGSTQLNWPESIYIDDDEQKVYICDSDNHRVVEWKFGSYAGQVVAGGNGQGNRMDQLDYPADVIVNKKNDSLIICDHRNRRVVQWSRQDSMNGHTIIFDIDCYGLALTSNGDLYVSDIVKNEVRRWKVGDTSGVLVAGGNGEGNRLDQLFLPTAIFVDRNNSIYISDEKNHRVMKWLPGARQGVIVAGGHGEGDRLAQLSYPQGVTVDHAGNVYVADSRNQRIVRWTKGSNEGSIILGGHGQGKQPNQFHFPKDLSFDRQGHLYIVDWDNNRVQKFDVDLN